MILIEIKTSFFSICQIWFLDQNILCKDDYKNYDFLYLKESKTNLNSALDTFYNGIVDLQLPEDKILSNFTKDFQYEIRRAEKENFTVDIIRDISNAELLEAHKNYVVFSKEKGLETISYNEFSSYKNIGALVLAKSYYNMEIVRYHIYFYSQIDKEFLLLASFPNYETRLKKTILGWGNRHLHWKTIQYFKSIGCLTCNLGGIGNKGSANNENIIKFKHELNPSAIPYYNGIIPISFKAKIYFKVRNLLYHVHK